MPTYAGASQRAKKMPTLSRASSSKSRGSQSTLSSTSGTSQSASATPVKDIYDYDFVDDVAPTPKLTTKPRPFSNIKPTSKNITASSSSTSLAASSLPSSTTPRQPSAARRQPASRAAVETVRSLKRKPSQLDATPSQRPSGYAPTSLVSSTSRYTGTQQAKKIQRPSASPDPVAVATSPSLYRQSRPAGKAIAASTVPTTRLSQASQASQTTRLSQASQTSQTSQSSQASTAPAARPRVTKTPPRTTARLKSPINMRSPSAQTASIANSTRKPQSTPAASYVPYRPVDGSSAKSPPKVAETPRQPPARATPAVRPTPAPTSTQRKRRRLIDTLVDQLEEESLSPEDEQPQQQTADDDDASSEADTILSKYKNTRNTPMSEDRLNVMELESIITGSPSKPQLAPATPATITRTQNSRRKFVYNVQRTMLAEDPTSLDGPQGSDLSMLESLLPDSESKQDSYDFDDDAGASQGAIQSIHELRQAGANTTFSVPYSY